VYYSGIKVFNTLPVSASELINDKHFILAQKRFLIVESFHSINEYLNYQHAVKVE
jgi:hypothetical protein